MTARNPSLLRDWQLVLASASESRLRLLRNAGCHPVVQVSNVDEAAIETELGQVAPTKLALALAEAKAIDVANSLLARQSGPQLSPTIVVGADSVLDVDGKSQGKPLTAKRALAHAREMRGRSADLITGHCLISLGTGDQEWRQLATTVSTTVYFGSPTDAELAAYVASGEPLQVAGGFTLDGLSAPFIEGISGDPSNVIGLSLPGVRRMLAEWTIEWVV